MPELIFIEHSGIEHRVQGEVGKSIMQIAIDNMVPGVLADCGGNCSCATCHGYVDTPWAEMLPVPSEDEVMMIEAAIDVAKRSRLTCQITMAESLDGMVVRWPKAQV